MNHESLQNCEIWYPSLFFASKNKTELICYVVQQYGSSLA